MEHRNIPEGELHEPKGVSLAASNRVYRSNGAGGGAWAQVDADTLQGLVTNATAAGRRLITDGSGGFVGEPAPGFHRGAMHLTGNTAAVAMTEAVDGTLRTDSDYQVLDLAFSFSAIEGMTSGANFLQIAQSGFYLVDFWANVKASNNNTRVGLKFVVNDTDFVTRRPIARLPTAGELSNFSANGFHSFNEDDTIKVAIASNNSTNVTVEDLTIQLILIGGL